MSILSGMMNKSFLLTLLCLGFRPSVFLMAQHQVFPLPAVDLKTPEGKIVNSRTWSNDGKPMIVNFWATWCKPCVLELSNIAEEYEEWQKETGVKLIAVSIDDARNAAKVAPFVKGRGWAYEVYLDSNEDFKRAMNVTNPPHTFVVNGKGEVVWQHMAYQPGDEKTLYKVVKKVAAGLPVDDH